MRLDVLEAEPVFKGCPPAVEPYLKNDLAGVARALERDGQAELGFRLLATMHQAEGESGRAADFYESAGDVKAAGLARSTTRDRTLGGPSLAGRGGGEKLALHESAGACSEAASSR